MSSPATIANGIRRGIGIEPYLYRVAGAFFRRVPMWLSYAVGLVIADIFYFLWESKRESAQHNFARVLGLPKDSAPVRQTARNAFRNYGRYIVELLHLQGREPNELVDNLSVDGEEHFEEAKSHGRGVIFVSAHFGALDTACAILPIKGYSLTSIAQPLKPRILMDWLMTSRARMGVTLLPPDKAVRRLLRALKHKEMIAVVIDTGVHENGGVPVKFCGHDTLLPAGPAWLARLSGAPLVFGTGIRLPGNRCVLEVSQPIMPERTKDAERDLQIMTQKVVDIFEKYVRRYPDQWYIFRDMWPRNGTFPGSIGRASLSAAASGKE